MLPALKLSLSQAICRFFFAGVSIEHGDAVGMLKGQMFLVGGYEESGARLLSYVCGVRMRDIRHGHEGNFDELLGKDFSL